MTPTKITSFTINQKYEATVDMTKHILFVSISLSLMYVAKSLSSTSECNHFWFLWILMTKPVVVRQCHVSFYYDKKKQTEIKKKKTSK